MYQVYKLVRAINRTYPNNGVINQVNIDEDTVLDEDIRDLINESLHESYKEMALDEVFTIELVPGQNEYALPKDCDTSMIQEVTRTTNTYPHQIPPVKPIEKIVEDEKEDKYYQGGVYPADHYKPQDIEGYVGWLRNPMALGKGYTRRLVWARDAEELTGDRYFNVWGTDRIGIFPTPNRPGEIITIYYKKKPDDILLMTDDIQVKDKYLPILKYAVCMKLAMLGSNPDINMYNVFANKYDELMLEARREKDSDMPFYEHVKDNDRPSAFLRRRTGRSRRW